MATLNEQQLVERFRRGVSNGAQNYTQGVTGAGAKWQQNAASDAAEARWRAGVEAAAQQKARQKALQSKSGQDWETQAKEVGAANYTRAATKAGDNYAKQAQDVLAAGDAARNAAVAIPGETLAQRLQRGPAAAAAIHRHWARKKGITPQV